LGRFCENNEFLNATTKSPFNCSRGANASEPTIGSVIAKLIDRIGHRKQLIAESRALVKYIGNLPTSTAKTSFHQVPFIKKPVGQLF
jgi:hypothetical protein